jgi:hypothetical protein
MSGSALKVCVGGVESEFSDCFGYSLALAKPNKTKYIKNTINLVWEHTKTMKSEK